jgi:FkbM family methyltransferase
MLKRIMTRVGRVVYAPTITIDQPEVPMVKLGTEYGGWTVEDTADLVGSTILSCGLGEDASFDIEFAARYDAKVVLVDPTPRAIAHFERICERYGMPAETRYTDWGNEKATAYDLSKVGPANFALEQVAIWNQRTRLKFYEPPNPGHVSYSIVNFQQNYRTDTPAIEVQAETPEALLAKHGIADLPLMKLDIEGAEVTVIHHMLDQGILPRQICVEYDELWAPSKESKRKVEEVDARLRENGYLCRHFDGTANYLYTR